MTDKAALHSCNTCERNESNIIMLSIEATPACRDLSGCPYVQVLPGTAIVRQQEQSIDRSLH